jgi:hypothetical protein
VGRAMVAAEFAAAPVLASTGELFGSEVGRAMVAIGEGPSIAALLCLGEGRRRAGISVSWRWRCRGFLGGFLGSGAAGAAVFLGGGAAGGFLEGFLEVAPPGISWRWRRRGRRVSWRWRSRGPGREPARWCGGWREQSRGGKICFFFMEWCQA